MRDIPIAAGQRFFNGSPSPENNRVKIPEKPGLGFEPNYDMLKDSIVQNPDDLMEVGMQMDLDGITKV